MKAYSAPDRVPISWIFEIWATKAGLSAVYVPELNPNAAANTMAVALEWPGSHSPRTKIVDRPAAQIEMLKLPSLSAA